MVDSTSTEFRKVEYGSQLLKIPSSWLNPLVYGLNTVYLSGALPGSAFKTPFTHEQLAEITVDVKLVCGFVPAAGAMVTLTGNDYPFPVYSAVVPASGIVTFGNVIEGNYTISATLP